jgi:hypothetical protein
MSEAFVNQVTLDCLLNKEMFSKHIKTQKSISINKEERRFYKKRIFNLFKQIISKEEPTDLLPDVKYAYDNFINSTIHYFKTIDNNDFCQEEYKDLDETTHGVPDIPIFVDDIKEEDANKLLMRSIKVNTTNNLDNFIKKKKTTTNCQEEIILPIQKVCKLDDPELKNKGICKKKNITNKYDETCNSKKEIKEEYIKKET